MTQEVSKNRVYLGNHNSRNGYVAKAMTSSGSKKRKLYLLAKKVQSGTEFSEIN
jgi:hypothetical protein